MTIMILNSNYTMPNSRLSPYTINNMWQDINTKDTVKSHHVVIKQNKEYQKNKKNQGDFGRRKYTQKLSNMKTDITPKERTKM